jgi:hypothetical protein
LGGEGVSLISLKFEAMGFPFHRLDGGYDVGIDAMVELRDPTTGEMSNTFFGVQCKATRELERETDTTFDFTVKQADLDYWSKGTMPVLLVVAHPSTGRAWWVAVRKEMQKPTTRLTRRITFDKSANLLDESAVTELLGMAQAAGSGTYFRPVPTREELHTNLLEVTRFPLRVWRAETEFRDPAELFQELTRQEAWADPEWFLADGAVYAMHDLRDDPWPAVCDTGTVESFDPREEWGQSEVAEHRRLFVRLLTQCLRSKLYRMQMRFQKEGQREFFYFMATDDLSRRVVNYRSRQNLTSRIVFREYMRKDDPNRVAYYRHVALERRFEELDGRWYLRINPTYHYTSDGREPDPFREERLAGIKQIERNKAVSGSVAMFAALLRDEASLFADDYRFLGFGDLLRVNVDVGIPDALWEKRDELLPPGADASDDDFSGQAEELLFDDVEADDAEDEELP